ncbi:MAG: PilZ domain-containing protein [Magnetococcus sp. DMHC-8]
MSEEKEQHGDRNNRREDRLVSHDPASMVLADGRRMAGRLGNMNLGGMLFVVDGEPLSLEEGATVEIELTLYGRESRFACTVTHRQDRQFGLQLHRQ